MNLIFISPQDVDLYWKAAQLRSEIFYPDQVYSKDWFRERLCDELEDGSFHVVIEDEGAVLAYGRLSQTGEGKCRISQMVVRKEWQNRGLGRRIFEVLLEKAKEMGWKFVWLNARIHAVGFYEKFGFTVVSDEFLSERSGLPHVRMERREEYFEVFNEDGTSTRELKLRNQVHRDGDWHCSVHVVVINSRGEILVQKRQADKDVFSDMWDISCAGHLEPYESSRDGGVRELKEELGIDVSGAKLELLFRLNVSVTAKGGLIKDNEIGDVYLLRMDLAVENLVIQESEVSEVKWMPLADFRLAVEKGGFVPHGEQYYGQLLGVLPKI